MGRVARRLRKPVVVDERYGLGEEEQQKSKVAIGSRISRGKRRRRGGDKGEREREDR